MRPAVDRYDPIQRQLSETGAEPLSADVVAPAEQWLQEDIGGPAYPFILPTPEVREKAYQSGTEATIGQVEAPRPIANVSTVSPTNVLQFPSRPQITHKFNVLGKWEGTVSSIEGEEFDAVIHDLRDASFPEEKATFSVQEVPDADKSLIVPGAVFYWNIGYETNVNGQKKRVSIIRFRRLPAWTRSEIEALYRKAETFRVLFGPHEESTEATGT